MMEVCRFLGWMLGIMRWQAESVVMQKAVYLSSQMKLLQ
jgi:hypothetical protein